MAPRSSKIDGTLTDGEQYTGPDVIGYICSYCNRKLIKITDAGVTILKCFAVTAVLQFK